MVAATGWCGKGCGGLGQGLGGGVIVCEVDPIRALEALMDGYQVMPTWTRPGTGEYFHPVTGNTPVFPRGALHGDERRGAPGQLRAILMWRFRTRKTCKAAAEKVSEVRKNIREYLFPDGRRLYLLSEGRLVNLAAGDGHPVEIMDLSFGLQVLSILYLKEEGSQLAPGVHPVPAEVDRTVARLALAAAGVEIDTLTAEQERYLSQWTTE